MSNALESQKNILNYESYKAYGKSKCLKLSILFVHKWSLVAKDISNFATEIS